MTFLRLMPYLGLELSLSTVYTVAMRVHTRRGRPSQSIDVETLPNRVRALRLAHGMGLLELAKQIEVGASALSEFELEGRGISRAKIYALADIFSVDPRVLETAGKNYGKESTSPLDNTSAIAV